jgi:adenine-specific DNA-methyltransferase
LVSSLSESFRSSTLPGLGRAFRRWVATLPEPGTVAVPGASEIERQRLAALGGLAASIAEGVPRAWDPVIRQWADCGPVPPEEVLEATRQALGREEDPLGALYNACISAANRRRLGTVFTPPGLVEHMFQLVERELNGPPSVVVDPGAGVGAFTIAAVETWPDARIVASDINPVTLGLLGARLAFEADAEPDLAESYRSVELRLGDYLDELERLFAADAAGPVLVLGNPPYTRVQELPAADREKAARLAGDLIDSGHANLAMLFQAATLRHMRPQDVSCMVVPGSFSYTRASRALRSAIWRSSRTVVVHRTPAVSHTFTGRSVQAAVLLIGRERKRRDALRLGRIQLNGDGVDVLDSWKVARAGLQPENWFWSSDVSVTSTNESVLLGGVAVIRRGTATGANDMFFLTDDERALLPPDVSVAAIPTLRGFDGDDLTADTHAAHGDAATRRWLLAIPPEHPLDGALSDYVARYRDTVSKRHLPRQRAVWYSITELPRPQVLISPLSKTEFKVVVNTGRAVPSNNLFGISLKSKGDVTPLVSWLRSQVGQRELLRASRRYPGGSHKLEPGDLRRLPLPAYVAAALAK